jgi:predicted nucleic acid-binding protein
VSDTILVDTSAWILSFRESGHLKLKEYLKEALDRDSVAITNIITLELLQGCKMRKEYDTLKARLDVLPSYPISEKTWTIAYEFAFVLRRKGITVPTIDIMICSIAKENALKLLHHDNHLKIIAQEMGAQAVDFLKD